VLLIEAGGRDDYHWIHIPVGYLYCIGNPRTDWLYQTEPDAGLNGRKLRYPRGKTLGGCSSINGMIYMRGQARDYDGWAALGEDSWRWDNCLPHFKRHEDHMRLAARPTTCTAPAANGGWSGSACAGMCSTPSRRPRSRPASRPPTTSTAAATRAWATSRSTRKRLALEHAKAFLRPTCYGRPTSRCGRTRRWRACTIERGADGGLRCRACRSWTGTRW
jgi:choline dehydrogenase